MSLFVKVKSFLFRNYFLIVAIILFVIPFFWFGPGEVDIGGDSSRLYFIDPFTWLKNIALYTINALNSLNIDNPNFHLIPFLLFLTGLKHLLGGSAYLVNCAFSGLLLSGSFVFTSLSIKEIITEEKNEKNDIYALIGGLFFAFSPLIMEGWLKSLYGFNQILVYPAVFYFFLKYIKSKNNIFIYLDVLFCFLFSVNFGFSTFPWFFAFFPVSFFFLFLYSSFIGRKKIFFKGLLLFVGLFLLSQLFHLLSQVVNVFDFSNPNSQAIFSKELSENRGLSYFASLQPYARLLYSLLNQSQLHLPKGVNSFDYGLKQRYFYYLYIVLVILAGVFIGKRGTIFQRKIHSSLVIIFLVLSFFMTANITHYLADFYKSLFSIPGFSMFRSFYSKFGMIYAFFYAMLLALSVKVVFKLVKTKFIKFVIVLCLFMLILFNSWPLVSGIIVNTKIWQSKEVKIPSVINEDYLTFLSKAREKQLEGRYLTLPLTNEEYQILGGKSGGAYFGPSVLSILGGKNDFVGFNSFNIFRKEIINSFETQDFELLKKYFSMLNIKYIFHNSDDYIYQNFPSYPYSTMFKEMFPTNKEMVEFIDKLDFQKIETVGKYFSTYATNTGFLPRFYVPHETYFSDGGIETLSKIYSLPDFRINSAVYFYFQNLDKTKTMLEAGIMNENVFSESYIKSKNSSVDYPVLEYKKINNTKYIIRVHRATQNFQIIFSDMFNPKWKVYLSKKENLALWKNKEDLMKKISNKNNNLNIEKSFDQASFPEIEKFIQNGSVTALKEGDQKDFISNNIYGSIQNDNLPFDKFYEAYVTKKYEYKNIPETLHFTANGYANGWFLPVRKFCNDEKYCRKNTDNSYDFEIIIEFWQQKFFYLGTIISAISILTIFFLIFIQMSKKNEKKI